MKTSQLILASAVVLTLLGAGCTSDSTVTGMGSTATDTASVASTTPEAPAAAPDGTVAGTTDSSPTPGNAGLQTPPSTPMKTYTNPGKLPAAEITNKQVRITTNKGDIVVVFYPTTAPLAVSNFIYLAENGFYDNVIFHRVISGFMIQGGDPTGTGMGGPGYKFTDELTDSHTYTRGTLAMANSGPNTNGSQFFIMHKDYPLPHDYTIFGHVTSGLDVVDAIAATPTDSHDRPLSDIVMEKVTVETLKK